MVGNASVADEIESSAELCRAALATDPLASLGQLFLAPQNPQACFDLVLGIPYDARRMEVLRRLKRDAGERGHSAPFAVERFLALQAFLVALPLLQQMPLPDSIKRQFCITCRDIASTTQPDPRLALEGHPVPRARPNRDATPIPCRPMQLRCHAPHAVWWLLKAHPLDLSGFIQELCLGMRGVGPFVEPHINYWRANQMVLLKREHERAIWRIAQFVEEQPAIKGLVSSSWLYGVATGEQSPHLAWLREFFAAENALIIDAGPVTAFAERGFLVGNELRRQQYASGVFRPRETIVLWRRTDMLAWARRHPEYADGSGKRAAPPPPEAIVRVRAPTPRRRWQSGKWTVIDGRRLLFYRPRPYIVLVLMLPALLGAAIAGSVWDTAAIVPAFVVLAACLWVLQYFFLQ